MSCAEKIVKTGHVKGYLDAMVQHRDSSAILIRLAYILGNLTTNFEEARVKLCRKKANEKSCFLTITELACFYLENSRRYIKTTTLATYNNVCLVSPIEFLVSTEKKTKNNEMLGPNKKSGIVVLYIVFQGQHHDIRSFACLCQAEELTL